MAREYAFDWTIELQSTPESLWPLAADTNRFNHDTGLPPVTQVFDAPDARPGMRRLFFTLYGIRVEWDEQPFEWIFPYRFAVNRYYRSGPLAEMRVVVEMTAHPEGGTRLRYRAWAIPAWPFIGDLAIWGQIGVLSRFTFLRTFQKYDQILQRGGTQFDLPGAARFSPGGRQRLAAARRVISNESIFERLAFLLEQADDLALQRLRPYQLADLWKLPRRTVLETFLHAARAGVFDIRWELLCPMCRGAAESHTSLGEVHNQTHCPTCNIDFSVNFDRQVEAVFRPNPAVRAIPDFHQFCVAGPHSQTHNPVIARMMNGEEVTIRTKLEEGRYSFRASGLNSELPVAVLAEGETSTTLELGPGGWPEGELRLAPQPTLRLANRTGFPQNLTLQRTAWRDDAATAADVTSLQLFRDLFSREALRAGEEISINSVTLLFTDLRNSTRMYRQIGDAPAFGRVRQHFDLLEQSIAAEGGAVVKTIGDSVMAVFRQPVAALRAIKTAHAAIAALEGTPSLAIKVGLHTGPCIVVTLNERLDYFGSTVNIAARLPGLAEGGEIVFSNEIKADPEVKTWLRENTPDPVWFQTEVKGYDQPFDLWRMWL
jgi:class 3 adenylate cyclase